MVELHGWALLRENFTADNEDTQIEQIVSRIAQDVEDTKIESNLLRIEYSNAEATLTATRFTNHLSDDITRIIDLFKRVASIAPGSYGLLYLHNDEDTTGLSNAFQVYVLSKGTVTLQQDPFLSPFFPTVEEAED